MIIEQAFPQAVLATGSLTNCLASAAAENNLPPKEITALLGMSADLRGAGCFLDAMTGHWRYEFGSPYGLDDGSEVLGTHMWVEVGYLCSVLACVRARLSGEQQLQYLKRLADPSKHQDVLAEMSPMMRVNPSIPATFEVAGYGEGNRAIDWLVGPHLGRSVLLDVKRRAADFRQAMNKLPDTGNAPPPDHDPVLMFRSVEQKFAANDPVMQLQGVWISTDVKQEKSSFDAAFRALDPDKVHFAILGDWRSDACVVTRLAETETYIRELFKFAASARFTFAKT